MFSECESATRLHNDPLGVNIYPFSKGSIILCLLIEYVLTYTIAKLADLVAFCLDLPGQL